MLADQGCPRPKSLADPKASWTYHASVVPSDCSPPLPHGPLSTLDPGDGVWPTGMVVERRGTLGAPAPSPAIPSQAM